MHTSHITLTNLTQKLKKNWRFFVLYNSTAWIVAARDLTKDHNTDVTYYVLVCLQFLIRHRIVPHDLERNIKIYSLNIIFAYINSCAKVFFISLSWFLSSPSACRTSGASKNPEKYWLSWYFTPHYFANTLFNHLANTHHFWKPLRPQFATTIKIHSAICHNYWNPLSLFPPLDCISLATCSWDKKLKLWIYKSCFHKFKKLRSVTFLVKVKYYYNSIFDIFWLQSKILPTWKTSQ